MITKMGYLFMFDIHSGKALYRAKISEQTIFVTTTQVSTDLDLLMLHSLCESARSMVTISCRRES